MSSIDAFGRSETASRHKKTRRKVPAGFDQAAHRERLQILRTDGYVVIEGLLDAGTVERIRATTAPMLRHTGRNLFEDRATQRLYSVAAKTRVCDALVQHPVVLALVDEFLLDGYLLSQLQAINILPGQGAQMLHYDDAFYQVPRPRPPLGLATVWAIDAFTEENGSTVVVPGSHRWDADRVPATAEALTVKMAPGAVVVFLGTLWHGGGANTSTSPRLAITSQYCEPWLRTQENFSLSTPPEVVAQCSEDMRRMLGYSIFGPFMGAVDGLHPKRLLRPHRPAPGDVEL